jgi:nucleotide-binding universal stress UspA family protein
MNPRSDVSRPFKILLAVDGSGHSFAAAKLVSGLPLPQDTVITLLGIITPYYTPGRAHLELALQEAHQVLAEKGLEASSELLHGSPPAEISKYAENMKPDLIVIGAKGLHATMGILLGGVAQQIVEYARCPVLVVRAPHTDIKNILLLTDGSSYSDHAAEYLARVPLPDDVTVHVMHVLAPFVPRIMPTALPLGSVMVPPIPTAEDLEAYDAAGQAMVDRAAQPLKARSIETISVLERGDPVEKVIEYAKAHEIQLIVCGSRGLGSLSGWLLGSVSRKLVHYFDCSVLVVKSSGDATR